MIIKLKMCTTGKIFGYISLKVITDTFFQYLVCNQGRVGVRHEGKGGGFNFLVGRFRALSSLSLICKSWSPIKNTLKSVLSLITVIILKRRRESIFFKSNKFTVCKVRDGKEVANLWWCSIYVRLSIHFKVRNI